MKTNLLFPVLIAGQLCSVSLNAQIQLPQPSPKASVMQTAGLTDITIDYSSPGVKGRKIWGELVPYNEIWRAGANAATKITFSKDVFISGLPILKGSYSIFITPSDKEDWTIIINKDAAASVDEYKTENDIIKIKAKPLPIEHRERLAYSITEFNDSSAMVNMIWEKVQVSFKVALATEKQSMENITNTLNSAYRNFNGAARYMLENKKDFDNGLTYINQSLALSPDQWYTHWLKAQLLKAKGMDKDAYTSVLKAKELGDKAGDGFFYKKEVEKAVIDWKPAGKKK